MIFFLTFLDFNLSTDASTRLNILVETHQFSNKSAVYTSICDVLIGGDIILKWKDYHQHFCAL